MSEANKAIARSFMEDCWNRGDLGAMDAVVAKDCRHHDPVFPTLSSGLDGLKRHIESCRAGFPDLRFSLDDVIAERDEVVIHWTARGTHRAQFLGMAATNRTAAVSGTSIYKIDRGKIREQWSDWNVLSLLEQLGLATVPKAEMSVRK
jgi:steroid delta-isomerase-like uncharacterized protein